MQDWCQRHSALEVTKEASLRRRRVVRADAAKALEEDADIDEDELADAFEVEKKRV
jgi:hypothetical protein